MQKAWFYEEYGPKEVLKLGNFPIPSPKRNQLLVQVHAAALNIPIDFRMRQRPIIPACFPVSGEIQGKLKPYLENGILKAVIDPAGPFHFSNVPEAFGYLETGRARGKVVIASFPSRAAAILFSLETL